MVTKRENVLADYCWILRAFGFTWIFLALPVSAAIAFGLRHAKQSYLTDDLYK